MKNKLTFANIPTAYSGMMLNSFDCNIYTDNRERNKACNSIKGIRYWLENFSDMKERGLGLYLYSATKGSGKTRAAASIANELIDKGIQVKFSTSLHILDEIKRSWNDNSESELLKNLSYSEILVIDDFGAEQDKAWINERFYQIINERYINKRITIYTSNLPIDNLNYDERITNRIKERSYLLPFPEESVRDIIAKENMAELISGIRGVNE